MEEKPDREEITEKEAPKLKAVLKEIKQGLDTVRSKVKALTSKVKANEYPTADGISYLEAKHLLLLSYCQCLVYYLLRKAKGLSIEGHPVVRSLVEIRLYLEKIKPIDKKMEYQIHKLTRDAAHSTEQTSLKQNESEAAQKSENLLNYRPNPDMLVPKVDIVEDGGGLYRPPKIAPAIMDRDKMSKEERNAMRREKDVLRRANQGYIKDLIDNMEERPEEVRETYGIESKEIDRYRAQWEKRAQQEEELFSRVPLTKLEKKREKHLKKSRNGLLGLTDSFFDEVNTMPLWDDGGEKTTGFGDDNNAIVKLKKRKRH